MTPPVRRVRGLLITPAGRLLALRRTKPGEEPHWSLPGGGIEPGDPTLEAALKREIWEEACARPQLQRLIHIAHIRDQGHAIFVGRVNAWSQQDRTGPEFLDPANGSYDLEELPLDPDLFESGQVWPAPTMAMVATWLRQGIDLFGLPDLRHDTPVYWTTRHGPPAITMVTGSSAKAKIAADHLAPFGIAVQQLAADLVEIQSTQVAEIACDKAHKAFTTAGRPVIVEDSSFGLDELGGYPGALIKHLVGAAGAHGVARLADLTTTRACTSTAALVYIDDTGPRVFTHTRTGTVAVNPQGPPGRLPLWTVYIPDGHDRPLAALPEADAEAWATRWAGESVFAQFGRWYRERT